MNTIMCRQCGVDVAESESYYDDNGRQVCSQCFNAAEVASGFLNGYRGLGSGALIVGILSFCCNPFYLCSIAAIASGIGALTYERHLDPEDQAMIRQHSGPKIMGGFGVGLGAISAALNLLMDAAWLTQFF